MLLLRRVTKNLFQGLEEAFSTAPPNIFPRTFRTRQELAPDPPSLTLLTGAVAVASQGLIPRPLWMIQGLNQLFNCR